MSNPNCFCDFPPISINYRRTLQAISTSFNAISKLNFPPNVHVITQVSIGLPTN